MTAVHFGSFSAARTNFKDLLDAADDGRPATVSRDDRRVAVVDADRLRHALTLIVPAPQAVPEGDGWSLLMPGLPVAADGADLDAAIDDLIDALREYAEDWNSGLRLARNHRDNWGLVQLLDLSSDQQLHAWITGQALR
ncbi:MAG: hypothetical protein U0Q15_10275 [Kineosporiaceae bacterium]